MFSSICNRSLLARKRSLVLVAVTLLSAGGGASAAFDAGNAKPVSSAPSSGCYHVRGFMAEESADAVDVVGHYKLVLTPSVVGQGPALLVSGPLSGTEDGGDGGEGLYRRLARAAEEEGPHGHHVLGTDERIGTLKTDGDSIEVTGVSCIDGTGAPRIIQGVESLTFVQGSGVFSKLISGKVDFKLTYNACNNKNNPKANLEVIQGQLCFQ